MVYHKDNKRPNIRPSVLRQIVPIYPNYVYNINRVDQTYNQIMSMGYFKSANVIFNEQADSVAKDNYVTFVGEGKEPADSVHQTREGYLQCDIQCIPALKQGYKIELEGSTTSSFYGLRATVGYQNRNIFRGAESFDVSFSVGYEYMKTPSARKRNAIEFGVNMGLQFPVSCCLSEPSGGSRSRCPGPGSNSASISRIALIIGVPFPAWLGDIRGAI